MLEGTTRPIARSIARSLDRSLGRPGEGRAPLPPPPSENLAGIVRSLHRSAALHLKWSMAPALDRLADWSQDHENHYRGVGISLYVSTVVLVREQSCHIYIAAHCFVKDHVRIHQFHAYFRQRSARTVYEGDKLRPRNPLRGCFC